ncbi:MAG: META domain-containing protein [Actinomycetes bacterium]
MRHARPLALAMALVLMPILAACSASGSGSSADGASVGAPVGPRPTGGADLANTSWALSGSASSTAGLAGSGITLEFTFNQARGNGGVNSYSATYTAHPDGRLKLGPIISTMMAGDPGKMKTEADYLSTLGKVTGYSVDAGLLDLFIGPDQVLTYTAK